MHPESLWQNVEYKGLMFELVPHKLNSKWINKEKRYHDYKDSLETRMLPSYQRQILSIKTDKVRKKMIKCHCIIDKEE